MKCLETVVILFLVTEITDSECGPSSRFQTICNKSYSLCDIFSSPRRWLLMASSKYYLKGVSMKSCLPDMRVVLGLLSFMFTQEEVNKYNVLNLSHPIIQITLIQAMDDRFLSFGSEKRFKFIIIGDSNVGKTTLFWKYTEGEYLPVKETQVTTIDFKMKNVAVKDQMVKLYIWDTAGQERYRAIVSTYFKGCHGMVLVFDETSPATFDNLINQWYPLCLSKTEGAKMVLVGNKIDLQRNVNQDQIKKWCEKTGIKYFATSVKDNKNVEEPFLELINLNLKREDKPAGTQQNGNNANFQKATSFDIRKKASKKEEKKCC